MAKRLHKKPLLILLSIVVVIVIIAFVGLSIINQPVSGKISVSNGPDKPGYSINLKPKYISSGSLSFNYPAGMTVMKTGAQDSSGTQTFTFSVKDITSWLLSVVVSAPRGGTLQGDSGYNLRQSDSSTYQESQLSLNGQNYTIFSDSNSAFAKTAYTMFGDHEVSVSLTGDDLNGSEPLQSTLLMVLNSLHYI